MVARVVSRRFKVVVCRGPDCGGRGSADVHEAFRTAVAERGLVATVELGWQSCFGRCTQGPNVLVGEAVAPTGTTPRFALATLPTMRPRSSALYNGCRPEDVGEIVDAHIVGGQIVRRLIAPIAAREVAPTVAAPPPADPKRRPDGDA
jgi:(2Fe-2S) ferredoxin